MPKSKSQ